MPARKGGHRRPGAITGPGLIRLLEKDGWLRGRMTRHGQALRKPFPDKTRITVVPTKNAPLPDGTLGGILGPKQTGLGKAGLQRLIRGDP